MYVCRPVQLSLYTLRGASFRNLSFVAISQLLLASKNQLECLPFREEVLSHTHTHTHTHIHTYTHTHTQLNHRERGRADGGGGGGKRECV